MLGKKRLNLVNEIKKVMQDIAIKMSVRQIYYQLVSKHIIENSSNSYKSFNKTLTLAREEGLIDPFDIIDNSKPVLKISSWNNLKEFLETVRGAYRKSIWDDQDNYVEIWLEKDALRGVFQPITDKYDVHLVIGRGYQSYTNLVKANSRLNNGKKNYIFYFGDFDPTGLDIPRTIKEKIKALGADFEIHRIAINPEQIEKYNIPPIPTKKTDSRTKGFVAKYGDNAVEIDALNPRVLQQLIEGSILNKLDKSIYTKTIMLENMNKAKINKFMDGIGDSFS